MESQDDKNLIEAVRGGDSLAFQAIYFRYVEELFGFLWNRTPDRETAEDLVQETFAKLWQKRQALDPSRHFRAFMFQIARNLAIDHLRRKQREGFSEELEETRPGPETDPEAFVKRDRIKQALSTLSGHQRAVFCLSRFEGLRYQEIAEMLCISVKTVEVHMGRALKKLRERLHDLAHLIFVTPLL